MKKIIVRRWLVVGITVASLSFLAVAQAQQRPFGPGRGRPPGETHPALNLTAEQQQALQNAHAAIATQSQELFAQLQEDRTALNDAVFADNLSADAIRAAAAKVGATEGELAVIRATELGKIRALFTADQWQQLKTMGFMHRGGGQPAPIWR